MLKFNPYPYEFSRPSASEYAKQAGENLNNLGSTLLNNAVLIKKQRDQEESNLLDRAIKQAELQDKYGSLGARRILKPQERPKSIFGPREPEPTDFDMNDPQQFVQANQYFGKSGTDPYLQSLAAQKTQAETAKLYAEANKRPGELTPYQKEMLRLQNARLDLDQNKRMDALEAKASKKETAQKRVSENLETMASLYQELSQKGGIVDVTKGPLSNIGARTSASGIGQSVGRALGTEEQSLRNRIQSIRPLLMNDIRQASEMGARGLDSEKELEFYLQAATDPSQDIQYNLSALQVLDKAYGLGSGIKGTDITKEDSGNKPKTVKQGGVTYTLNEETGQYE